MSDTEIIPKPHQLIIDRDGVTRWSALFDSIRIESLSQGGKRICVTIKSDVSANFDLSKEQITHLVGLLSSV